MSTRPSFQWFPGDWRRDTALQSLPLAVRGLWLEMLNIMHDGEPYGHLTAGGVAITVEELARMVGGSAKEVAAGVAALEARKVLSRTAEGVIYSRRMVRDEAVRVARADGGRSVYQHGCKGGGKGGPKGSAKGGRMMPTEVPQTPPLHPPFDTTLVAPFDPPPAFCSTASASTPPEAPLDEGGHHARVLRRHRAEAERVRDRSWGRCMHEPRCESREACVVMIARDLAEHAEHVS